MENIGRGSGMTGRVALVSGGGRGIGRAVAQALAGTGARVGICARTRTELRETARAIRQAGGSVLYRVADVTRSRQVQRFVEAVLERWGRVDVLVNAAGILGARLPLRAFPEDLWRKVLEVNLTGTFLMSRAVLPVMAQQGSGTIVTITSSVGREGRATWGAYAVSKFGVEGLTQILAAEEGVRGIRVFAVNPGGTRTRMRAQAYPEEDPSTLPDPDRVAGAILHLLTRCGMEIHGRSLDARDFDAG